MLLRCVYYIPVCSPQFNIKHLFWSLDSELIKWLLPKHVGWLCWILDQSWCEVKNEPQSGSWLIFSNHTQKKKNPHFWPNKKGENIIVAWDCRHITLHIKALKTTCRIKEQHSRRVSQPTQWSGGQTEKQPEPETQAPSDHLSKRLRRKRKHRCNCALKNHLNVLSISSIHKWHDIFPTARKHTIKATGSACESRTKKSESDGRSQF